MRILYFSHLWVYYIHMMSLRRYYYSSYQKLTQGYLQERETHLCSLHKVHKGGFTGRSQQVVGGTDRTFQNSEPGCEDNLWRAKVPSLSDLSLFILLFPASHPSVFFHHDSPKWPPLFSGLCIFFLFPRTSLINAKLLCILDHFVSEPIWLA